MSLLLPSLSLAPYLLMTLALVGLLWAYFILKRELASLAKRNRRVEAMLLRLREGSATFALGASAPGPAEPTRSPASDGSPARCVDEAQSAMLSPAAPRPGMNLNRRVQALRLLRRGEDLGHIASALGVPRCEVELLVRVHRLAIAAMTSARPVLAAPVSTRSQAAATGG